MASALRGSVLLQVPIERAWDLWVDAARYTQWQSMLLAVRELSGARATAGTTYVLDHGPKMQRRVRVLVAERPVRHVIEQQGMGIHDETTATFEQEDGGTRLTLVVIYRLGRLMSLLTRFDRTSRTERELQRELDRLAVIAARIPPPARVGGLYLAEAGAVRRRLTVIAVDDERIHVRVHPGHLGRRDPDDQCPIQRRSLPPSNSTCDPSICQCGPASTPCSWACPSCVEMAVTAWPHLALSLDAWADTLSRDVGDDDVTAADTECVAAWRERRGPTVGVDGDLDLAPTCTFQLASRRDDRRNLGRGQGAAIRDQADPPADRGGPLGGASGLDPAPSMAAGAARASMLERAICVTSGRS